jgi:hypothetical protein
MPLPSSTADAHGPSWCEPTMIHSSEAPGSVAITLCEVQRSVCASTVSRARTGPAASNRLSRAPSDALIQRPGIGRSMAS